MVKKRTILFIFAWLLIFPMSVQAADVEYTLFDSTIQVNQDRTLDVRKIIICILLKIQSLFLEH